MFIQRMFIQRMFIQRMLSSFLILLTLVTGAFAEGGATPAAELEIIRVTPDGEGTTFTNQVVFEFNRPMVPIGRMERRTDEVPITITPALDCEWRWLNTTSLACQLGEKTKAPPATSFRGTVSKEFKAHDGKVLGKAREFSFTSGRPEITEAWFEEWKSPGMPYLRVAFNQEVVAESIEKHLYLFGEDKKRYPLKAQKLKKHAGWRWTVEPEAELPLDTSMELKVEPGLASSVGLELGTEDRSVVKFVTFPSFKVKGIKCYDNSDEEVFLEPGKNSGPAKKCNPLNVVWLVFSSPVIKEEVTPALRAKPDFAGGRTDFDPWEGVDSYSHLEESHMKDQEYLLSLPYGLKSASRYDLEAEVNSIKDEFGRPLVDGLSLSFETDHRLPKYHLENSVSVLEKNAESQLPLVVTNLKDIDFQYQIVTASKKLSDQKNSFKPYEAVDLAYAFPIDIRRLLGGESGVVQGIINTKPYTGGTWFFSQVTPFHVHVKLGHFSSLAWVTQFDTGEPVKGAVVRIVADTLDDLKASTSSPTEGAPNEGLTDENGIAMLPGLATVDPTMMYSYQWDRSKPVLMVRVDQGGEIALVPASYDFKIYGDVYPNEKPLFGHIHTWGSTAQGLYKAGDTIQYKLWVRDQNNNEFVPPPTSGYKLQILDPTDKVVHEVENVTLSDFGAYDGEYQINSAGAVGWYRFSLSADFAKETWEPLRVLVSDFTPAPFKVSGELDGAQYKSGNEVKVHTEARLHAGGPYASARGRITATIEPRTVESEDPAGKAFTFGFSGDGEEQVFQKEEYLNDKGDLDVTFPIGTPSAVYGNLIVESAVRDDRGKFISSVTRVPYVGRDRYVGIYQPLWILEQNKEARVQSLVIDEDRKISVGDQVLVLVEYQETKASRVKGAGNAYITNYVTDWIQVHQCSLVSRAQPVDCAFTPARPGLYRMTATVKDSLGREHSSISESWASGTGDLLWKSEPNTDLKITPEKTTYKIGDTAKFFIQNPYPGARALITLERYGIQKSWVTTLKNSTEIIEVPVTPEHIPGFFFSAVVMSPRQDLPIADQVDLGKPAFRMGYVALNVIDPYKQLVVDVTPQGEVFRPRDKVTVDISAHTNQNTVPEMEYAVTVLDEAVFDLLTLKKAYFDPYGGFYSLDGLDVANYNILKMLIGLQKFEKKGASAGGDGGGKIDMRSLFKFVSYWNPALRPDKDGKASITFEVPDNLTGWRVFVMAMTKGDRMGLGEGAFKVNKPTEIRSALPNQVTEGDQFVAAFTVMNRTDSTRKLDVQVGAAGNVDQASKVSISLTAEPFKRYPVTIPLKTKGDGAVDFIVSAGDSLDRDEIKLSMPVRKRAALELAASYGTTTEAKASEVIAFPKDIRTDVGSLSVVLSPSVIGGVESAFRYIQEYPYSCWEQKLTKGVMGAHFLNIKGYLPDTFSWPNADEVAKQTLQQLSGFQAPNGGMTFFIAQDQYVSPYLSAYTGLALNWLRNRGYAIPQREELKLQEYLINLLKNDAVPDFYSVGMKSSVRAVALAALSEQGKIALTEVMRYKSHAKEMNLFGKAHLLQALTTFKGSDAAAKDVFRQIMSSVNQTGGKFIFSEPVEAVSARIMDTNMRSNCAVLSSILSYRSSSPAAATAVSDIPFKLVRAITQERKRKDRWENTQENMFCMNALIEFSKVYESEAPSMEIAVALGDENLGKASFKDVRDEPAEISRPIKTTDPGSEGAVAITRSGTGRLYYSTRLRYAPTELKSTPINSGMELRREYSVERSGIWTLLKSPMTIRQGELVKVDLFLRVPAPRNFVVIEDPIPGGLESVNRDLATASTVDAKKDNFKQAGGSFWFDFREWIDFGGTFWSFYHKELRHESARFYSEYLPIGNYHLSYVAQAIAPGEFAVLPTHAEEMYDPDVFGQWVPEVLNVEAAQ
jgi:uncharacterized protein YfaS (alpha-2-macroglobulin family)